MKSRFGSSLLMLPLCLGLLLSAYMGTAQAQTAQLLDLATISMTDPSTPKTIANNLCYSDGRDLACDGAGGLFITSGTLALGGISVSGVISTSALYVNGLPVTGGGGSGATNVISSGTTSITTFSSGIISFSTGGVWTGNMDTAGRFNLPGISITQNYGISTTYLLANSISSTNYTGTNASFAALAAGNVSASGNMSAVKFIGDGSLLTGISAGAGSSNVISSGTTSITTFSNGHVSFSTGGVWTGTMDTAGRFSLPGVSITGGFGISSTNGYFSGNVGIGTALPSTKLEVVGTISATSITVGRNNLTPSGSHAFIVSPSMIVGSNLFINQPMSQGLYPGGLGMRLHYAAASQIAVLDVSGTGGLKIRVQGDNVEAMTITNSGTIGIGTTTPSQTFEVSGTISAMGRVIESHQGYTNARLGITAGSPRLILDSILDGSPNMWEIDNDSGRFRIFRPNQATLGIQIVSSTGFVGVGMTGSGPTTALEVSGTISSTGQVGAINVQTFNADGTWTKPAYGRMVFIQMWGAGGSGGRGSSTLGAAGGGGGGYFEFWRKISDLGATEPVTVGVGGAAVTGGSASGNPGGSTSFGSYGFTVGGGGGGGYSGTFGGGGGGGGLGSSAVGSTGTSLGGDGAGPAGATGGNGAAGGTTTHGGGGGGGGRNDSTAANAYAGGFSIYGGGGGGGAHSTSTAGGNGGNGGNSMYGGAGGGGGSRVALGADGSQGGSSYINGGNGGTGGGSTTAGTAGTAPGGGGGGSGNANSGAGANGRVIVTVF